MTQEEKQLLLKDLCGRLPYQPMCEFTDTEDDFCTATSTPCYSLRSFIVGKILIKPYLRPMSSMTEEEEKVFNDFLEFQAEYVSDVDLDNKTDMFDWLNEHHFDYRGLIPMGLALEAPEGMYKQ